MIYGTSFSNTTSRLDVAKQQFGQQFSVGQSVYAIFLFSIAILVLLIIDYVTTTLGRNPESGVRKVIQTAAFPTFSSSIQLLESIETNKGISAPAVINSIIPHNASQS